MIKLALALLLWLAPPSRAEVPGGHLVLGIGGDLLVSRFGGGAGFSLDAQIEIWRFFIGGSALFSSVERSDLQRQGVFWIGPKAGYFFTDNPLVTGYLSVGLGRFEQGQLLF